MNIRPESSMVSVISQGKTAFMFGFGWVLFVVISFIALATIGHFFLLDKEGNPAVLSGGTNICEGLRLSVNFPLECNKYVAENFPDMKCVTSVVRNDSGKCAICNFSCERITDAGVD